MLSEQVNPRALIAKYERDDLNQQWRKESLRLYGVQVKEKETNEELMQTVLTKIAEADVPISEEDISVCHRQGAVKDGMQPILVKFVRRNKRNEVLSKNAKDKLRAKGLGAREDLTPLRSKLLQVMRDSDLVDSVRVSNGKLYAYKEKSDGKFAKIRCVTTPDDRFKLGIQAVDYEQLGLTKYMVDDEDDSDEDMFD